MGYYGNILSITTWWLEYGFALQVIYFFLTGGFYGVMVVIVRDKVLKEIKKEDPIAFQKATNIGAWEKPIIIKIDKTYNYSVKVLQWLNWWSNYVWGAFSVVIMAFLLMICAS